MPNSSSRVTDTIAFRVPKNLKPKIEEGIERAAKESGLTKAKYLTKLLEELFIKGKMTAIFIDGNLPVYEQVKSSREIIRPPEVDPQYYPVAIRAEDTPYVDPEFSAEELAEIEAEQQRIEEERLERERLEREAILNQERVSVDIYIPSIHPKPSWDNLEPEYADENERLEQFEKLCEFQNQWVDSNGDGDERYFCPLDFPDLSAQVIRVSLVEGWIEATEVGFTRSLLFQPKDDRNFDGIAYKRTRIVALTGKEYDRDFVQQWEESGFDLELVRGRVFGNGKDDPSQALYAWELDSELAQIDDELRDEIDVHELPVISNIGGSSLSQEPVLSYEAGAQMRCVFEGGEWLGEVFDLKLLALFRAFWFNVPGLEAGEELKESLAPDDRALVGFGFKVGLKA